MSIRFWFERQWSRTRRRFLRRPVPSGRRRLAPTTGGAQRLEVIKVRPPVARRLKGLRPSGTSLGVGAGMLATASLAVLLLGGVLSSTSPSAAGPKVAPSAPGATPEAPAPRRPAGSPGRAAEPVAQPVQPGDDAEPAAFIPPRSGPTPPAAPPESRSPRRPPPGPLGPTAGGTTGSSTTSPPPSSTTPPVPSTPPPSVEEPAAPAVKPDKVKGEKECPPGQAKKGRC